MFYTKETVSQMAAECRHYVWRQNAATTSGGRIPPLRLYKTRCLLGKDEVRGFDSLQQLHINT